MVGHRAAQSNWADLYINHLTGEVIKAARQIGFAVLRGRAELGAANR